MKLKKEKAPTSAESVTEENKVSVSNLRLLVIIRLVLAIALAIYITVDNDMSTFMKVLLSIFDVLIVGYDLIIDVLKGFGKQEYVGENLLLLVAVIISFSISRIEEGVWTAIIFRSALLAREYALTKVKGIFSSEIGAECDLDAKTLTEERLSIVSQIVVLAVLLICVVLMLVLSFAVKLPFTEVLRRVASVMSVGSLAGLVAAVPLTFFAGTEGLNRIGVFVKNSEILERLPTISSVILNKPGVITGGKYTVDEIKSDRMDPNTFLKVAAFAAGHYDDPVFNAVRDAFGDESVHSLEHDYFTYPGKGVSVRMNELNILFGRKALFIDKGISLPHELEEGDGVLYMSVNGMYAGHVVVRDNIKDDVRPAIDTLRRMGVTQFVMVSEDSHQQDMKSAEALSIQEYYSQCKGNDKLLCISEVKKRVEPGDSVAYITADKNDDDALKASDIGISLAGGSLDSDLGMKSLEDIRFAIDESVHTKKMASMEVLIAGVFKIILITLAGFGLSPLWFSVFIDGCVSLGLILDSLGKPSRIA